MKVSIEKIKVGERFRKKFDKIDELAESIKTHGQIEPIVLDKDYNLVCGERRLRACKMLCHSDIDAVFRESLTELQSRELELEENVQREAMDWPTVCGAKRQIHLLKSVQSSLNNQPWTLKDTAILLDKSIGDISQDIELAEGIRDYPQLLSMKNKTDAYKEYKKLKTGEITKELMRRKLETIQAPNFVLGNCVTIMKTLQDESFNLCITDPPWGVNIEDADKIGEKVEYDDTEALMKVTTAQAYEEIFRLLKPGSHAYIFFGIQHMSWHVQQLSSVGFEVDEMPGLWTKGSRGAQGSPYRESNSYETYLHVWKGEPRKLNKIVANDHRFPRVNSDDKIHTAEKPIDLILELITNSSDPGDSVLDPFAGSAVTLRAAAACGRNSYGCELSEEVYLLALGKLGGVTDVSK